MENFPRFSPDLHKNTAVSAGAVHPACTSLAGYGSSCRLGASHVESNSSSGLEDETKFPASALPPHVQNRAVYQFFSVHKPTSDLYLTL